MSDKGGRPMLGPDGREHRRPANELAELLGADEARAAINAGWKALRESMANRVDLVHPGIADYVVAVALLGAIPVVLGANPVHVIDLRADGWTIKHPLACRPNLFDCPVNRAAERDLTERPPQAPGQYVCTLDAAGFLQIGPPVARCAESGGEVS